jgi:hypothetical protein
MLGVFNPHANDWRERKLWVFRPQLIQMIEVETPEDGFRIERGEGDAWNIVGPPDRPADQKKAQEIVRILSDVRAAGFADDVDLDTTGLEHPELTVTVDYGTDTDITLDIGTTDDAGKYYGRVRGGEQVYLFSKKFVDSIPVDPPIQQ